MRFQTAVLLDLHIRHRVLRVALVSLDGLPRPAERSLAPPSAIGLVPSSKDVGVVGKLV